MQEPPPLLPIGADRHGVRLRALRDLRDGLPIIAFLRGIELGRIAPGAVAAGAEFTLPILRMPRIEPPMALRFAATRDGPELAPPFPIATVAEAVALVGPGEIAVSALRLESGVLRGYAENRVNGWMAPLFFARVNGAATRAVHADPPQPLAAGGSGCRFALPLLAEDLRESGLDITLHVLGHDAPLAHWAWTRTPAADIAPLEARLAAHERALQGVAERLEATQRAALVRQQERIDAFITAAATLLFDRIAVPPRVGVTLSPDAAALRALIAAAGAPPPDPVAPPHVPHQADIWPDGGEFGLGWHPAEHDAAGAFRWMGGQGMVMNPQPQRAIRAVRLDVAHCREHVQPDVTATLDDAVCTVAFRRVADRFVVDIVPADAEVIALALRLHAPGAGVPARLGTGGDHRELSFAVARVVFDYA